MVEDKKRIDRLIHFMLRKVNKAVYEYNMIQTGDRIAVALSGGKDSFSLLRVLQERLRFVPEEYSLVAIHVIGDARGTDLPPHPELAEWLRANEIDYRIMPTHIGSKDTPPLSCERCTWNRRRSLFETAVDLGCTKLAFGHHLDDLAETALLNLMYHGRNETMAPSRTYFDGKITIIRPLAYVPEREIKRFSRLLELPPPPSMCPRGEHTQRRKMKDLLSELEHESRSVKWNLASGALREMKRSS